MKIKQVSFTPYLRYVIGAILIIITLFFALAPGLFSPLRPLTDEWFPSLSNSDARIAAHILGFSGLLVVMVWASGRIIAVTMTVLVLAMSIELIQVFLPWRDGTWKDVGLNLLAISLGRGMSWLRRHVLAPPGCENTRHLIHLSNFSRSYRIWSLRPFRPLLPSVL